MASLRASLTPVDDADAEQQTEPLEAAVQQDSDRGEGPDVSVETPRPQLRLVEPRTGATPKRRSSQATSVSLSDPDAKLRHKPGQRPHLVHRGQVAVDPKARCVVACLGEQADGHEGDALVAIIERARFACPKPESLGTDQGYAAERVWNAVAATGITGYVPPQRTMLPAPGEKPKRRRKRPRRPRGSGARLRPVCGPTFSGWATPKASSESSSTSTGWTAPARAAPRCSTCSYYSAARH